MKLILHMCCGPCSTYPIQELLKENFEIQGLYYNPNIHPIEEHTKRKENVEKFSSITNIPVAYDDEFRQDEWEGMKGIGDARCHKCYTLRLEKAARFTAENDYDAFTTTLFVSPYQKHDLIRTLSNPETENLKK